MIASDIVTQLGMKIPQFSDKFTNDVKVDNIALEYDAPNLQNVFVVTCDAKHDLDVGDAVAILGSYIGIAITSITRADTLATIVFATDHDATTQVHTSIELAFVTDEPDYDGVWPVSSIPNRRTIVITVPDTHPASAATGYAITVASALQDIDGTYGVTDVRSEYVFAFQIAGSQMIAPLNLNVNIMARTKPRITGVIDIERAIAAYTSQKIGEYWMFVALEDVVASKSRDISSDAIDNLPRGNEYRQQLIQPFTVYTFAPVSDEIAARLARDVAENLFVSITKSLAFHKFDGGLFTGKQNPVVFDRHGVFRYDTSLYIHSYAFQQVVDLTFDDTVGHDEDVALRDLNFEMFPNNVGTESLTGNVDLDDTPL